MGSNRNVYVQWSVGERDATPWITLSVKNGGRCYSVRGFYQLESQGFVPGEGQIGSDLLSQHHTMPSRMWFVSQGFVLMQDNDPKYTSKLAH